MGLESISNGAYTKANRMTGIMRSVAIGGSMLLVAASNSMVLADDNLFPAPTGTNVEQPLSAPVLSAPVPISEPISSASGRIQPSCYGRTCSPKRQPRQQGCYGRFKQRCQAKYWGYPEEFCDPPLGTMLMGYQMTQIANGQAARMALYQYDFLPESDQLNSRGRVQLARMAEWMTTNDFPVFVEPTSGDSELDELRRQTVWLELTGKYLSIPSERVLIGTPNVRGLDANDALLIDRSRLDLTATRGASGGGGGGSTTRSTTIQDTETTDSSN
jgi:hypothetical protein